MLIAHGVRRAVAAVDKLRPENIRITPFLILRMLCMDQIYVAELGCEANHGTNAQTVRGAYRYYDHPAPI